ncbi:MAG: hypothetical protein Q9215_003027 [Flavoplaca cf. flavocitrina]
MRTSQILLLLISLLSLSLAASTPPGGSRSASYNTNPGKTSGTRQTVEGGPQGPGGPIRPTGPKNERHKKKGEGTTVPDQDPISENSGGESTESYTPEIPETDDRTDQAEDQTPTFTFEDASETPAAQEERSRPIEMEANGVSMTMTRDANSLDSSMPTPLSIPTSASSSSEETETTPSSGAGMDLADMSLLGLLVAVGMGVLAY